MGAPFPLLPHRAAFLWDIPRYSTYHPERAECHAANTALLGDCSPGCLWQRTLSEVMEAMVAI